MISKPATDSNFIRDFSMKYDDKTGKVETASTTKPKVWPEIYDASSWNILIYSSIKYIVIYYYNSNIAYKKESSF